LEVDEFASMTERQRKRTIAKRENNDKRKKLWRRLFSP